MTKTEIAESDYRALLDKISYIIFRNGLKATTMDTVAALLGMSKRTLYEIFESKSAMINEAIDYMTREHQREIASIFDSSDNVMEAMLLTSEHQCEMMQKMSPDFFSDMDHHFKEVRSHYDDCSSPRRSAMMRMFAAGVQQGVFRDDVDYRIQMRLMELQMESLKRMEEVFPSDITLAQAYRSISLGFLRSIASVKGMEMLEKINSRKINQKNNNTESNQQQ